MLHVNLGLVVIEKIFERSVQPHRVEPVEQRHAGIAKRPFDGAILIERFQRIARQNIVMRDENLIACVRKSDILQQGSEAGCRRLIGAPDHELRLGNIDVGSQQAEIERCSKCRQHDRREEQRVGALKKQFRLLKADFSQVTAKQHLVVPENS